MRCLLRRTLLLLTAGALPAACSSSREFTTADSAEVARVLEDYREAWMVNDEARVMGTVSDDVTMFVPGAGGQTLKGSAALRTFWFPKSDTLYRIGRYEVTGQEVHGGGDFAIATGRSELTWDTVARDSVLATSSSNSEFVTVLRRESGGWKLFRQIYVLRAN
jgi:ketosteroid isomerase-like protein